MAALPSLMALYGALDPATSEFESRAVAHAAARYLPITARSPGWFDNLMEVFGSRTAEAIPDPESALADIVTGDDRLTVPELSRLVYVIGALCHTPRFEQMTLRRETPLARALALAGPDYDEEAGGNVETGDTLLRLLYAEFEATKDFDRVVRRAVVQGLLSADVAAVPRCIPSTQWVDGYECVVIDTSFGRSDIHLHNLKDVADPLNWHRNYPHAFCEMDQQVPDLLPNGWSRVRETVSLDCQHGWPRMVTPLEYYKSDPAPDQAVLQYDLDKSGLPAPGDGRVTVDRGFIKMWATGNPGVWVRTRKIVHIDGLWPAAQAMFVCPSGYAWQAAEMIFGNAENPPADTVPWQPSPTSATTASTGTATGPQTPTTGGSVASTATQTWIDCLKDLADKNLQLSTKWWKNQLTVDDLVTYTQDVGAEIASAPWRLIQALSQPPDDGTPGGDT
ncbi:hypothetical protein [uncultured Mycobacterium sp.]|uniref:hypothetical protein n=1 Tax=uncultured Mycobacterium sp. TaxID=171292 RepID=UPI0035CB1005